MDWFCIFLSKKNYFPAKFWPSLGHCLLLILKHKILILEFYRFFWKKWPGITWKKSQNLFWNFFQVSRSLCHPWIFRPFGGLSWTVPFLTWLVPLALLPENFLSGSSHRLCYRTDPSSFCKKKTYNLFTYVQLCSA